MITELKPTNLIAVEVAKAAWCYRLGIIAPNLLFYTCDTKLMHERFPRRNKYKIVGEVTKDKIGFDVDKYGSFYTLLAFNGLFFDNPIRNPEFQIYLESKHYEDVYNESQSFEDKLIKGKLLILEKI